MQIERVRPYKHFPFLGVSGLRLVCFVFAGENELPVRPGLNRHLAQQGVGRVEIHASGNLPEEVDLGKQVSLRFEMAQRIDRGESRLHLNIMNSKYIEKKSKEEESIGDFNFKVLQKQIRTIKKIELTISFTIFLFYDQITG